jgi:hypothetical protein
MKKLLIVVPYRDRSEHLKVFLEKTPKYFREQNIEFDIIICELEQVGCWNAGLCCNSIIKYEKLQDYEYIFIHHVDIYPIDGKWEFPDENESFIKIGDFGSCIIKTKDFLKAGGYSNSFWGWGGEDNLLYSDLSRIGISLTDKEEGIVKFDTHFQNHERKFNGLNYSNLNRVLYKRNNNIDNNNIFDFDKHGIVYDFIKIEENVYKHKILPLKRSPLKVDNKNVLISYVKHLNKEAIKPFIKSALLFAPYEYDVVVCISEETATKELLDELNAFNVICYIFKPHHNNLYVDRFYVYKTFLNENKKYTHVIHADAIDVYFQSNPFVFIKNNLVAVSENIKIKDQIWNYENLKEIYGEDVLKNIENNEVICSGIIGGPVDKFINLCALLIEEMNNISKKNINGIDQILLQKLIYEKKIDIKILNYEKCFCIHMHTFVQNPDIFKDIFIRNKKVLYKNILFSIVHQYNRDFNLNKNITDYYNQHFSYI